MWLPQNCGIPSAWKTVGRYCEGCTCCPLDTGMVVVMMLLLTHHLFHYWRQKDGWIFPSSETPSSTCGTVWALSFIAYWYIGCEFIIFSTVRADGDTRFSFFCACCFWNVARLKSLYTFRWCLGLAVKLFLQRCLAWAEQQEVCVCCPCCRCL
jgi:hypothetical protein